jgi:hypothetical protein
MLRLMGVPYLRITRRHRCGAAMCSRGVLIHCPGRLGAAVAVLAAELLCVDGVLTDWALERAKAVHHCNGVMSHSFKCSRISHYDSELKLPPPFVTNETIP